MKSRLRSGLCAKVNSVDFDNLSSKKLLNMGFTPGTVFCIKRIAPLGDPIIVKIRNYCLAVRKKDLMSISYTEINEESL
jgi:ferrous iron transport protein A